MKTYNVCLQKKIQLEKGTLVLLTVWTVECVQPKQSPHLPLPSVSFVTYSPFPPPLWTSPSTKIDCSSDTEHKLRHTACLCDEWISKERKEEWKKSKSRKRSQCSLNHNLKCLTLQSDSVDLQVASCHWHPVVGCLNKLRAQCLWCGRGRSHQLLQELWEGKIMRPFHVPACRDREPKVKSQNPDLLTQ